ncbi:hypothetical protein K458DRAFT_190909 [Lentithecium fluviatile CBS 122367]|uniref:Uncharacterized protein n=1 Tax=Lentithecium fluviatile CBS 122367 TaxID=1168545 RepID=A0A6G1JB50_9PLEO|nr:hypothetical protein K458DRAFT_190909 [Lentithecium fluviatile CBS 122367]
MSMSAVTHSSPAAASMRTLRMWLARPAKAAAQSCTPHFTKKLCTEQIRSDRVGLVKPATALPGLGYCKQDAYPVVLTSVLSLQYPFRRIVSSRLRLAHPTPLQLPPSLHNIPRLYEFWVEQHTRTTHRSISSPPSKKSRRLIKPYLGHQITRIEHPEKDRNQPFPCPQPPSNLPPAFSKPPSTSVIIQFARQPRKMRTFRKARAPSPQLSLRSAARLWP